MRLIGRGAVYGFSVTFQNAADYDGFNGLDFMLSFLRHLPRYLTGS